jgi:EAL domain-containing protein (putative c-di-GMP-specific phosphodiesterase class I)
MKLTVIAEGVETEQRKCFCALKAATKGRGYLYSRPVSGADFSAAWHRS